LPIRHDQSESVTEMPQVIVYSQPPE